MPNAVHTVLFPYRFHCFPDQRLVAVLDLACQLLGPKRFEFLFQFCEDIFYGIIVRAVDCVKNVPYVVFPHAGKGLLGPVR